MLPTTAAVPTLCGSGSSTAPAGRVVEHQQRQDEVAGGIDQPDDQLPPANVPLSRATTSQSVTASTGTTTCSRMFATVYPCCSR